MGRLHMVMLLATASLCDALVVHGAFRRHHCIRTATVQAVARSPVDVLQLEQQAQELRELREFIDKQAQAESQMQLRLRCAENEVTLVTDQLLEELQTSAGLREELAEAQHELRDLRAARLIYVSDGLTAADVVREAVGGRA
jgi:septal ring factor EnvC (AmiA/AmiB activator)